VKSGTTGLPTARTSSPRNSRTVAGFTAARSASPNQPKLPTNFPVKSPAPPKENPIKPTPSRKVLLEILDYNQETGALTWKLRPLHYFKSEREMKLWNGRYAGTPALNYPRVRNGLFGNIFNSSYSAHRVIWKMMTGKDIKCQIDHVNRNPRDNSWSNLRKADRAQNFWNGGLKSCNTSGRKGVHFDRSRNQWVAVITHYRRRIHIGRFDTFEDACRARSIAEKQYHGKFANQ